MARRILFVWTGLTSYMGDCWRRLAAGDGVSLRIVVDGATESARSVDFHASEVLRGLDYEVVEDVFSETEAERSGFAPDVIFAVGWHSQLCRRFVTGPRFAEVPKVCCFDMPWRWKARCLVAPLVLGRFLWNYSAAFVPGAACARYARWLGFRRVYEGLFSIDVKKFSSSAAHIHEDAADGGRYFLYIGRNSPEKRLDDLRAAHALYVKRGGHMGLKMYGKGLPDGFLSPDRVPDAMAGAAAFVLASDFDPWPLVLLEAMGAGCPVIASDRCTNRSELGANWHVFKCGDVEGLATAMLELENGGKEDAPGNLALAMKYDCGEWVGRVDAICNDLALRK